MFLMSVSFHLLLWVCPIVICTTIYIPSLSWESKKEVLKEAAPSPDSWPDRNISQKRRMKVIPRNKNRTWSGTEMWKRLLWEIPNHLVWMARDEGWGRSLLWRTWFTMLSISFTLKEMRNHWVISNRRAVTSFMV